MFLFSCQIGVCMYACMYQELLKNHTHLANKADSDYLDFECIWSNYFAKSTCNLSIEAYYILAYAR